MAFFKLRKGGDESPATRRPPESIEAMRKRARHRLIGAGVLVLVGVIGFPVLFDTQPRPIAVDIPIEIPDREKVKPLPAPAPRAPQAPVVSGRVTAPAVAEPVASAPAAAPAPATAVARNEASPPVSAAAKAEPKAEAKPEPRPEPKPEPKAAAKPVADEAPKPKAPPEAKPAHVAAAEGRFVVQVGAFADPAKARATRLRVERAGLKTYTNVADTKDGKRVRVRVGPFETRAAADEAAHKIKRLDLPAAILTL